MSNMELPSFTSRTLGAGMPGLRGMEHVGFTVPNSEEAIDFFVRVMGCELIYSLGPWSSESDWMAVHLNVHPRSVLKKLTMLRCAHGSNIEIFEYMAPDQQQIRPRNSDIGGHHLAFYVDDLDAAVAYLKSHDIRILGEPTQSTGPSSGQRWVYFLSPWGMQLELVSFPNGKAYERDTSGRLWNPCCPGK
jgi:catechol 2,3-dioxygenase-like lactoylglutathione lyase family enzyme